MKTLNILLIEGFYGGSHRKWADQLTAFSQHHIDILSLPDRFWKWRMHGAAVTLARLFLKKNHRPDVLIFTDMIDVSVFLSLTRQITHNISTVLYFHENQLTYPWSQDDPDVEQNRNNHYGFINYTSALSVDRVIFNSNYHKDSFLNALPDFLKQFPDYQNLDSIGDIERKSSVIAVGIDTKTLDKYGNEVKTPTSERTILWNHRWEYDKDPKLFFESLITFSNENIPFKLIVLGEHTDSFPKIFNTIQTKLTDHILHFGYIESKDDYYKMVASADIIPVTSKQDFFGISIVEAMYLGVVPLLPNRLVYPEHLPLQYRNTLCYQSTSDYMDKLKNMLVGAFTRIDFKPHLRSYSWEVIIKKFDEMMQLQVSN